jgi:cytochrome b6
MSSGGPAASTTLAGRALSFLKERFPMEHANFNDMVLEKTVPVHRMSWAYYFGGLALFFFMLQAATGALLLFYYEPTVSDAHTSVDYITHFVPGGAFVRNMHAWCSSFMIFCVLCHLITTFAMKAFVRPREFTWLAGVGLLMITFGFGFTGYLLPWHQIAVNATKVGLQSLEMAGNYLPGSLASLPAKLRVLIQGEAAVGQATLSRFYVLHVLGLPLLLLGALGLHLLSVQLHGMSQGVDRPSKLSEKFFPTFVLKDVSLWVAVFLWVFVLALCLPFESFFAYPLFEPYDALGATPQGIKPEWYFFFIYYPLELLPFWVVMLGQQAALAVLALAPWIFAKASRRTLGILALAAAFYLVVMTVFGQYIYEAFKGGK